MSEQAQPAGADPAGLTEKLTPKGERRWAVTGCLGCSGFLVLGLLLTVLGVKSAQSPEAVWSQLQTYMSFEGEPEGYEPLFVVPFFDSRQIVFMRTSDSALVFVQEFSGRERETFEDAFDPEFLAGLEGYLQVTSEVLSLQGRQVEAVRYIDQGTFTNASSTADGFRDWLLSAIGMERNAIADITDVGRPAAVVRIRFSGAADAGGTILMVRSLGESPLDVQGLEELFSPFDLWAHVDSVPVLLPEAVWSRLQKHVAFAEQPKGYGTLFVLPFEGGFQTGIYRESDGVTLFLKEFTERGTPFEALDTEELASHSDDSGLTSGTMTLQGQEVSFVRYLDSGTAKSYSSEDLELRDLLRVSAITDPKMPATVTRILLRDHDGAAGTALIVRNSSSNEQAGVLMDEAALEILFQPFDLWQSQGPPK
jgi:hypothetical protein